MYTLERREGESLIVQHKGEELLIQLTETKNGKVKVNLMGPTSFEVGRKEIVDVVRYIEKLINK